MIDLGLVVARFLHYAASISLAGTALFPLYAYSRAEPVMLGRWRGRVLLWSAVMALISGVAWFAFAVANMSGSLADVADPEILGSVVRDTGFGLVWTVRMILAAVLVAITAVHAMQPTIGRNLLATFLAAGLLASLAGTGHSQIEEGWRGVLHVAADAAHLLAAGAWLGGLVPLGFLLIGRSGASASAQAVGVDRVLMRFSGMGYAAVAMLIATGLINSWYLVGSVPGLLNSAYGRILIAKLACFAGMLALAAANRFWLVPALEKAQIRGAGASDVWRRRLWNHVLSEQWLGLIVLLNVSILGTIRPAIGQ